MTSLEREAFQAYFPTYTWDASVAALLREQISLEYLVGTGVPADNLVRENLKDGILWLISVYSTS